MKGIVFDIQRYSIHDGPGIRTVVFLKGCPLQCLWCCNPESQNPDPEAEYHEKQKIMGSVWEAEGILEEIQKDRDCYRHSGGGVTLSGGEVLMQPGFAAEILQRCCERNIHTAVETSGYGAWEAIEKILPWTDLFLYDLKHMDKMTHKILTGVSNQLIMENARRIAQTGKEIIIRMPFVPGCNTEKENIDNMVTFMKSAEIRTIHLMPFHQLGKDKYRRLGREYLLAGKASLNQDKEGARRLQEVCNQLKDQGFWAVVGG